MAQPHDHGALRLVPDDGGQTVPAGDQAPVGATSAGPAFPPDEPVRPLHVLAGDPDLAAVTAGLADQLAEITQALDALAAGTAAVRADVEAMSGALAQTAAPTPAEGPRPVPVGAERPGDVVAQASRLATTWIQRARHHPLRAGLVMLEGWTFQLQETVARGQLLSNASIDEALAEHECPSARWLSSGRADALDPVRAAEIRHLHSEHHRMAALVLTEVRDGRVDEARRLLESEDGYAGVARRVDKAVRSWIDTLSEQPETSP